METGQHRRIVARSVRCLLATQSGSGPWPSAKGSRSSDARLVWKKWTLSIILSDPHNLSSLVPDKVLYVDRLGPVKFGQTRRRCEGFREGISSFELESLRRGGLRWVGGGEWHQS
jgi:hypothetical protein